MIPITGFLVAVMTLCFISCSRETRLPDDEELGAFVEISSRCAFADRAYSGRQEAFRAEIDDIDFPSDWAGFVDSLLVRYGAEADFWYAVYSEISDRSRSQLPSEKAGDVE